MAQLSRKPKFKLTRYRLPSQILAHRGASILSAKQTAALQFRCQHAGELLPHDRRDRRRQHKPVAGFGLEQTLHRVGDHRRRADHQVARPAYRLGEADALGLHGLADAVLQAAMSLMTLVAAELDLVPGLAEIGAEHR